jgi:hypothetical protein
MERKNYAYELKVCPLPISELAYTNCVYVSENVAKKLNAPTYIEILDTPGIFIVQPHDFVADGEICMNGLQRDACGLKNNLTVHVTEAYPKDLPFLKHAHFRVRCISKRNVIVTENELIQHIATNFVSHYVFPNHSLAFMVKDRTFVAHVVSTDDINDYNKRGILSKDLTTIKITPSGNFEVAYEFNPLQ